MTTTCPHCTDGFYTGLLERRACEYCTDSLVAARMIEAIEAAAREGPPKGPVPPVVDMSTGKRVPLIADAMADVASGMGPASEALRELEEAAASAGQFVVTGTPITSFIVPPDPMKGFAVPSLADIRDKITADFRAAFGDDIDVTPDSLFGGLIGITAERAFHFSQVLEDIEGAARKGPSVDEILAGRWKGPPPKVKVSV